LSPDFFFKASNLLPHSFGVWGPGAFFCQEFEDQSALPHRQQARPNASELGVLVHQNHPGAADPLMVSGGLPSCNLM
jgi:hypothetical protein